MPRALMCKKQLDAMRRQKRVMELCAAGPCSIFRMGQEGLRSMAHLCKRNGLLAFMFDNFTITNAGREWLANNSL